jgi:membrane-associated phospholipid phosphatase
MLALALSAWWWCGLAVVAVVSWSRVVLRDHTAAQTVVGALVGAVTAGLVFSWAR